MSSTDLQNPTPTAVVLFDGVCNLCNSTINFIIDRDPKAQFRFAAIQSAAGAQLLQDNGRTPPQGSPDSIILIENHHVYERSTAALRVAKRLPGMWKIFWVFIVVPRPIRDFFYNIIAKNRYRWFGHSQECRVPTPELRARFLQ